MVLAEVYKVIAEWLGRSTTNLAEVLPLEFTIKVISFAKDGLITIFGSLYGALAYALLDPLLFLFIIFVTFYKYWVFLFVFFEACICAFSMTRKEWAREWIRLNYLFFGMIISITWTLMCFIIEKTISILKLIRPW